MDIPWGDILGTLVKGGTGLILNHQNVQQAKGMANDAKGLAELEAKLAEENRKALEIANELKVNSKSNLPLYIGLGVGGVVIIGVVIFAVTRK